MKYEEVKNYKKFLVNLSENEGGLKLNQYKKKEFFEKKEEAAKEKEAKKEDLQEEASFSTIKKIEFPFQG